MLFVVGFIVVRLIGSSSKKDERRRSRPVADYSHDESMRAPTYHPQMPGEYITAPPAPPMPESCHKNAASKPQHTKATARPSRKSLKAPADIREAIVWGEILKRKF